ncbi:GspH/FimT family pseudopilin [Gammaproteobacteria bacterium]|nr:GspH/FimT family pseudopilin [Gammaproteobacteria bacterium]
MGFRYLPSSKTALRYPGFTLIEILVVISSLALLTALMTPNLQHGNPIVDLEQRAKALGSLINQARTLVITNRKRVFLCGAALDGELSLEDNLNQGVPCDIQGGWHNGILVVIDQDGDQQPSAEDVVVLYQPADSERVVISWRGFRGRERIDFLPSGSTHWQNGRFTLCSTNDASLHLDVVINAAGRSYISSGTSSRCPG